MLYKHKRSDMRKRSLLQKKRTGEWYEQHFQNGVRRGNYLRLNRESAARRYLEF